MGFCCWERGEDLRSRDLFFWVFRVFSYDHDICKGDNKVTNSTIIWGKESCIRSIDDGLFSRLFYKGKYLIFLLLDVL